MDEQSGPPPLAERLQAEHAACEAAWEAACVAPDEGSRRSALEALHQRLAAHFAEEEAWAFPAAQRSGWTGGTAVVEFRYQHQALSSLLAELMGEPAAKEAWSRFGQLLREHFRGEEMLIWPLL